MTSKYTVEAKVPPELPAILKDLSREVLREQPTNIYAFCTQYFRNLKESEQGKAPSSDTTEKGHS
eukprot:EC716090.1.p2 GENE.EC716090.1~~EC716090.1.p2  ORF type:complete len:65 (+),score=2.71 EC716090.1:43-237(+)